MTEITADDVDNDADAAVRGLIESLDGPDFSYSIVPDDSLADGGLGAGFSAWWALLDKLKYHHLNPRPEYARFNVDPVLVDDTLSKPLMITRSELAYRLWLLVKNPNTEPEQ